MRNADPVLECPAAEYRENMVIWCTKTGTPCGHVFFKTCKGWWALSPSAHKCPLRRETDGENHTASAGGGHAV